MHLKNRVLQSCYLGRLWPCSDNVATTKIYNYEDSSFRTAFIHMGRGLLTVAKHAISQPNHSSDIPNLAPSHLLVKNKNKKKVIVKGQSFATFEGLLRLTCSQGDSVDNTDPRQSWVWTLTQPVPWPSYLTPLCCRSFSYKMVITIPSPECCRVN